MRFNINFIIFLFTIPQRYFLIKRRQRQSFLCFLFYTVLFSANLVVKVNGLQVELDWQAGQAEQQGNRFLTLWKAKVCNFIC